MSPRHPQVVDTVVDQPRRHESGTWDCYSLGAVSVNDAPLPRKMNECPVKRDHFKKDISSSNHQFSGDILVSGGVALSKIP